MKILYLFLSALKADTGVKKKIINQRIALENLGCKVEICHFDFQEQGNLYTLKAGENIIQTTTNSLLGKIRRRFLYRSLVRHILMEKIDTIYIRYNQSANPFFNIFLKNIKRHNVKVLLEIPTYPYDKETKHFDLRTRLLTSSEKLFRQYMYKYVDKVVTFSLDEKIFNIPTIIISNGVNLQQTTMVSGKKEQQNSLTLTGVSETSYWHGFDRIIESLKEYYQTEQQKKITLNIVGNGDTNIINKLKSLTKKYNLTNYVLFHGGKSGEALDSIYDTTDIGIGSLARHKSGVNTMRALKNREYAAKGLPMIFSEDDPDFRHVNFVYRAKADESLIDLKDVIAWYQAIKESPEQIRAFAQQFSWDIQMKKVLDDM